MKYRLKQIRISWAPCLGIAVTTMTLIVIATARNKQFSGLDFFNWTASQTAAFWTYIGAIGATGALFYAISSGIESRKESLNRDRLSVRPFIWITRQNDWDEPYIRLVIENHGHPVTLIYVEQTPVANELATGRLDSLEL